MPTCCSGEGSGSKRAGTTVHLTGPWDCQGGCARGLLSPHGCGDESVCAQSQGYLDGVGGLLGTVRSAPRCLTTGSCIPARAGHLTQAKSVTILT